MSLEWPQSLASPDGNFPEFLGGVDNNHDVDTLTVSENLFHTVMRVARTDDNKTWRLTRHLILPDSMPIAFPVEILPQDFYQDCQKDGHTFMSTVVFESGCKDVKFVLNPVFCLLVLKIALTMSGTWSLEEGLRNVGSLTCAFQHHGCMTAILSSPVYSCY
jgi:hypothetical protein